MRMDAYGAGHGGGGYGGPAGYGGGGYADAEPSQQIMVRNVSCLFSCIADKGRSYNALVALVDGQRRFGGIV